MGVMPLREKALLFLSFHESCWGSSFSSPPCSLANASASSTVAKEGRRITLWVCMCGRLVSAHLALALQPRAA